MSDVSNSKQPMDVMDGGNWDGGLPRPFTGGSTAIITLLGQHRSNWAYYVEKWRDFFFLDERWDGEVSVWVWGRERSGEMSNEEKC